ncbi:hypothetical protein HC928_21510 [bacterium]|nr:hypothetical protein [bacterium]
MQAGVEQAQAGGGEGGVDDAHGALVDEGGTQGGEALGRVTPVMHAMPRCETRSRCRCSTNSCLATRSYVRRSVTV